MDALETYGYGSKLAQIMELLFTQPMSLQKTTNQTNPSGLQPRGIVVLVMAKPNLGH